MNWIPKSAQVANPFPDVVSITTDDYDHNTDWCGYPERQGYKPRNYRQWLSFFQDPPSGFDAFLERWLFWGALERSLNIGHLEKKNFLRVRHGRPVIRLKKALRVLSAEDELHHHVNSWYINQSFLTPYCPFDEDEVAPSFFEAASREGMDFAQVPMYFFCRYSGSYFHDNRRSQNLIWATCLLHEMVRTDLVGSYLVDDELVLRHDLLVLGVQEQVENEPGAIQRLLDLGWCPWEVRMLTERFDMTFCFYLSQMQRPDATQSHVRLEGTGQRCCSETGCVIKQIDNSTYTTAHAAFCDGCEDVNVDPERLAIALRSGPGRIPIISVDDTHSPESPIQVVPHMNGEHHKRAYIAISHVWSDGLGNLFRNALPYCQLRRIKDLVQVYNHARKQSSQIHYFWLDTLCVPPDSANDPDLQKLAIHILRDTYDEAAAVIVLDRWLFQTDTVGMPTSEKLARIVCSP